MSGKFLYKRGESLHETRDASFQSVPCVSVYSFLLRREPANHAVNESFTGGAYAALFRFAMAAMVLMAGTASRMPMRARTQGTPAGAAGLKTLFRREEK